MRRRESTKRAALLAPWMLLISMTGSGFEGRPVDGASAKRCLQLQSRVALPGTLGCTKFIYIRNSCETSVLAKVRRTQQLFSGTLRETFPVAVPAGGERYLGCAWWSGAMASTKHELLAARFLTGPGN